MNEKEELIRRALRDFMHKRLCEDFLEAEWYRTELEIMLYEAEFYTLGDYYSLEDSERDILPQSAYLASLMSLLFLTAGNLIEDTKHADSMQDVASRVNSIKDPLANKTQDRYENLARRAAEFGEWAGYTASIYRLSKQIEKELGKELKSTPEPFRDYIARQYPSLPLKPMPKKELDIIRALNGHDKIRVSKDIYREIFRQGIKYELELIEAYREYVKRSEDAKTAMKEAIKDTVFENAKGVFEKVATTETTTAMNKGTLDAGETESFIAGYQFRAIMDERTTIYCRPRNNMLISKNDPVTLAANTPPLHYNCRSGLIPMTKREIALLGGENRLQLDRIKFTTLETFNWATGKPD